jgi:hypothetical protein
MHIQAIILNFGCVLCFTHFIDSTLNFVDCWVYCDCANFFTESVVCSGDWRHIHEEVENHNVPDAGQDGTSFFHATHYIYVVVNKNPDIH